MIFRQLPHFSTITLFAVCILSPLGASAQTGQPSDTETAGLVVSNTGSTDIMRPRIIVQPAKAAPVTVAAETRSLAEIAGMERTVLELINAKREEFGLEPLEWSDDVARIARVHSEDMAVNNFFSHVSLDGSLVDRRADAQGVSRWRAIGENIAYNRGYKDPIAVVVEKWMQSAAHRDNLLSERWKETGIGIAVTPTGTFYFTQVFLKR